MVLLVTGSAAYRPVPPAARAQSGVRGSAGGDFEFACFHDGAAVEQDIDIDCSRAVDDCTDASEAAFHLLNMQQQLAGKEDGFEFRDRVQKPGLFAQPDGFRS